MKNFVQTIFEREKGEREVREREREEVTSKGRDIVTRVCVYHFLKIMLGFLYLYIFYNIGPF